MNRLKYDGPITTLAVRELMAPTIVFPPDPTDTTNIVETKKWPKNFNYAHNQEKWWTKKIKKYKTS